MAVLTMNSTQMNFTLANKNQAIEVLLADPQLSAHDRLLLQQAPPPVFDFLSSLFKKYYVLNLFSFTDQIGSNPPENYVSLEVLPGYKLIEDRLFSNEYKLNNEISARHFQGEMRATQIGSKSWMTENLNVDRLQDGSPIFHAKSNRQWSEALKNCQPAYCYPSNDIIHGPVFGKLYNVFAIKDSENLLPTGWILPTDKDWTNVFKSMGGKYEASSRLKETMHLCYSGYRSNSTRNAKNESLFSFSGISVNHNQDTNDPINGYAGFWSSTPDKGTDFNWARYLSIDGIERKSTKVDGLSVRAIKM
jgi:uncharacterized protein (TIGR02145 family)